jgi:nitroreductase
MIKDLIAKNRSYRRYDNTCKISYETLRELVELARLSASASNRQLLRFVLVSTPHETNLVLSTLKWAGYLTDWHGPKPDEQPTASIVIIKPVGTFSYIGHDTGIACQSILLGAIERGLGGCMFGSVDRPLLHKHLKLPDEYEVELVITLGKPLETVQIDTASDDNIRYWRDEKQIHHVPKLPLEKLIIE